MAYPDEHGHVKGSATSAEAAAALAASGKGNRNERIIYDLFAGGKQLTRLDVERTLGWKQNNVTPRIAEMIARGVLHEPGGKVKQEGFNRALVAVAAPYTPATASTGGVSGVRALREAGKTAITWLKMDQPEQALQALLRVLPEGTAK